MTAEIPPVVTTATEAAATPAEMIPAAETLAETIPAPETPAEKDNDIKITNRSSLL